MSGQRIIRPTEVYMLNPLAGRFQRLINLSQEERLFLDHLIGTPEIFMPQADLLPEDARSSETLIVVEGYACEYRLLRDGSRQIIRLMLRGDIFNQNAALSCAQQSSFIALTKCWVASVGQQAVDQLMHSPRLAKAWAQADRFDHEALLENIVRIGRRPAYTRAAHFICETHQRMKINGLTHNDIFFFPMNQHDVADLLGLSSVHTNRALRNLVELDAIKYSQKSIEVVDEAKLRRLAEFSNVYLHQESVFGERK